MTQPKKQKDPIDEGPCYTETHEGLNLYRRSRSDLIAAYKGGKMKRVAFFSDMTSGQQIGSLKALADFVARELEVISPKTFKWVA